MVDWFKDGVGAACVTALPLALPWALMMLAALSAGN